MKIKFKENRTELSDQQEKLIGTVPRQIILELWNGQQSDGVQKVEGAYDWEKREGNRVTASGVLEGEALGRVSVTDTYTEEADGILLDREVSVLEEGTGKGIRLLYEMDLFPEDTPGFADLRYFAPPAIFDKNDLDEDGYEDYFHTKKTIFRDDRFNYPIFMAYSEKEQKAVRLERTPLPEYDSHPDRGTEGKDALFLQKTDIGSMGIDGESGGNAKLTACYPFYEGNATIALYIVKMVPFGAFWPLKKGEHFHVSYRLSSRSHEDFHDACWYSVKSVIQEKKPEPQALLTTPEEIVRYRLKALDQYYIEKDKTEDSNEPAGYVLNCHPQEGRQLENIIQYGFTGQNIMNAYNVLRYGYETENQEYIRKAVRVADFFADKIHIRESGMFYNLYNIDNKKVNFWWTGLLLPLAYARGEELDELMGPLYEYRKEVIDTLVHLKGAYLRCMNEDATALLRLYLLEKKRGNIHSNWLEAIQNYGEFLLRTQEEDGGWYRAYDLEGKPIIHPEIWFGKTIYEKKSSTATSISFLAEMYQMTGEKRYLEAAERAGVFVKTYIIDRVRFNGGVHDSIYAKGQLIDNESILYPMFGMLSLYEATKKDVFLEGAVRAAHYNASWVCLWNVPLPEDSTLKKYGFNSIGMGACDTCGCGYVHPFQLMCVAEMAQIAVYAGDRELLEAARLYWLGCSQTVSLPENDWGYAAYGLQEEGYLVSWWAVDDPMFSGDKGFGHRWKGEGNKTCFPWINGVGVKAYWSLLDRFGTTDFTRIQNKYFS